MEGIVFALILVLFAGIINGSFATPMKYMSRWDEESIWFAFSFFGFLILPWLTIYLMAPNVLEVLKTLPTSLLITMVLGGIAFGIGQIAFALAFQYIGIGLAFVINISMGTSGSALIPLFWHKGIMGTPYSYVQILGIVIFIVAVIMGAAAGTARHKSKSLEADVDTKTKKIKPGMLVLGIVLAIIAGAGSVAQGVTYIWSNPSVSKLAEAKFGDAELASSIIAWVIIFSTAWIPYVIYFFILNIKKSSFGKLWSVRTIPYWFYTVFMGVGFWGSLIFFSQASNDIGGDLAPTIAWPLFMVFIILTSNFWSWKSGEWKNAGKKAGVRMIISLVFFVLAIVVFSLSSSLEENEVHHHFIKHKHHSSVQQPQQQPQ